MPIIKKNAEKRPNGKFDLWLGETPCNHHFLESESETCNVALNNIVAGATHFELAKTNVGGPR